MLHFSCDSCGRQLDDRRFVVRLEVYPAFDPEELGEEDLDSDNLQEVADLIEQMEADGTSPVDDCESRTLKYDLCPACQKKFLQDPLGRDSVRRFNFSEN
ncbi:MAG: hypothetical protein KDA79_07320 [Planctomycetaceae bacterium]|nr:hypothetical protein [Planctomycetaceae bacterium]